MPDGTHADGIFQGMEPPFDFVEFLVLRDRFFRRHIGLVGLNQVFAFVLLFSRQVHRVLKVA